LPRFSAILHNFRANTPRLILCSPTIARRRSALTSGRARSRARVEISMDAPQALVVDVGVDLRRPHIHVAQHLLDTPEIRTTAE
jgi:hypothetical protein